MNIQDLEIDGSPAVSVDDDGLVTTQDGRKWYWDDRSYSDPDTGHNWVPDGEWVEHLTAWDVK